VTVADLLAVAFFSPVVIGDSVAMTPYDPGSKVHEKVVFSKLYVYVYL